MRNPFAYLTRLLVVLTFALLGGPQSVAASVGVKVVICGADGSLREVVFDFETGAPAEPEFALQDCEDCVACAYATPRAPEAGASAAHSLVERGGEAASLIAPSPVARQTARGPPLLQTI